MRRGSRRALPSLLPRPVAQQCTCLASHLCGMCVLPRQEQVCLAATLTLSLSQECTELTEIINKNDQEPKFFVFLCCHVRAARPQPACPASHALTSLTLALHLVPCILSPCLTYTVIHLICTSSCTSSIHSFTPSPLRHPYHLIPVVTYPVPSS